MLTRGHRSSTPRGGLGLLLPCVLQKPHHELHLKLSSFSGGGRNNAVAGQQLMTMYRPFKCAGVCPALCGFCKQEMTLYRGAVNAKEDGDYDGLVVGRAQEPTCGGFFTPKVFIGDRDPEDNPYREGDRANVLLWGADGAVLRPAVPHQ
eukprot:Sspe_Gene.48141::Locus_24837_Transcript_1_1_Confidence_1.000_Length_670::g.48141::m.48141